MNKKPTYHGKSWIEYVFLAVVAAIAFGTIWTAYESHVANIGVMAWQHEFGQITQPDGPPNNQGAPPTFLNPEPLNPRPNDPSQHGPATGNM